MSKKMNSEISRTKLKDNIVKKLWAISAGRCEICNKQLYIDSTLGEEGNFAENAHIHAVSSNGPRHKKEMEKDELDSCSNLMLLCAEHHHLIDTKPGEYGEGILIRCKSRHESKIEAAASVTEYQTSRIISYFSNIDTNNSYYNETIFKQALRQMNVFPRDFPVIRLNQGINTLYQPTKEDICIKAQELERNWKNMYNDIVEKTQAISVFALAPQPLLIKLGTLIDDKINTFIFQCHREGHKWAWKDDDIVPNFLIKTTLDKSKDTIALVIDLSAEIRDDRIIKTLGEEVQIIHLTIDNPNRNFVNNANVLNEFVRNFRIAMELIKNMRPEVKTIHLFPVMPNSLAIKLGMDFMIKTDISMIVYEQSSNDEGFFETITIGGQLIDK